MIIDTGNRTDVPAFYSEWYMKRIREGYVMVRNPYSPEQVTRYRLDPEVVDALVFCSKNPGAHDQVSGRAGSFPHVLVRDHHPLRQEHRTQCA